MMNYTTKSGQTWGAIAWEMYGTMSGIKTLIEANPNIPVDAQFTGGQIVHVPIVDDLTVTAKTNVPWK